MKNKKEKIVLSGAFPLDAALTLDCGQSFRWKSDDGKIWHGVAFEKSVEVYTENDNLVILGDVSNGDEALWREYFDLDTDYASICEKLCKDKWLSKAITAYPGIRILKQEPWEALCSFIISQNNNIPRIKGIISRLCENLGEDLGEGDFAFPAPEKILEAGEAGLAPLRAGFRTKYILDAAEKVADGTVDFDRIEKMNDEEASLELQKIKGVGAKVAACTLLYGFGRVDCLPVDVWVKRILAETYPDGLPECTEGVRGIAQQYLFHWRRNK